MIEPQLFLRELTDSGLKFYTGVPDSLLASFCRSLDRDLDDGAHIVAANEGNAVSIALGHHLATRQIPVVYMQNSGLGNAINPLVSLVHKSVYQIPMVLIIGWRGRPGVTDEPQHLTQGAITESLLELMSIPYVILDSQSAMSDLVISVTEMARENSCPAAILVCEKTFNEQLEKDVLAVQPEANFCREEAIESVVSHCGDSDLIVSTTGKASRELYEIRSRRAIENVSFVEDFLVVGGMGHASSICLGLATALITRRIICLDGDGALLMHMGSLPINALHAPSNFVHVLLNNGVHDSVGGQKTVARHVDFEQVATGSGYSRYFKAHNSEELSNIWKTIDNYEGPIFIEVLIDPGCRNDLARPRCSPVENKHAFDRKIGRCRVG